MKLMASAVVILFASLALAQTGGTNAPANTEKAATTTTTTTTKTGTTVTAPTHAHDMAKMKDAHAMTKACEGKTGKDLKKCQDEAKKDVKATH